MIYIFFKNKIKTMIERKRDERIILQLDLSTVIKIVKLYYIFIFIFIKISKYMILLLSVQFTTV